LALHGGIDHKKGVVIGVAVGSGLSTGPVAKVEAGDDPGRCWSVWWLGKNPAGLVKQGTKLLGSSPELKTFTDTVRGRCMEAGKAAAVTAARSRIDAFSDRL
jgi:hypothetical protein